MIQLQRILMAILAFCGRLFALPTSAAHNGGGKSGKSGGFGFLPAFCVIFIFGLLTACGGGGGGGSGGGNTLTTTPIRYEVTAPELAALHVEDTRILISSHPEYPFVGSEGRADGSWFIIVPVDEQGLSFDINGSTVEMKRQTVTRVEWTGHAFLPAAVQRPIWHALGRDRWHDVNSFMIGTSGINVIHGDRVGVGQDLIPRVVLSHRNWQILLATRTFIYQPEHLCDARWLGNYINDNYRALGERMICDYQDNTLFSPDMRRVVHAVITDGFNSGFAIGESGFAFSGRHNGNNRAAGFRYDFGDFALRTDYIRLPSKQDSEVWLDTYRFGILRPINDKARFFAGVDSYRNAIFAIDTNGKHLHRFGIAIGDGYAARYEYRIRL